MGGFSLLIAAVVIFFTFRFGKAAVTEAKQGIAEERTRIQKLLEEANAAVASIRSHEQTAKEITENLKPGEAPASEVERKALRDIAREAQAKPRRERTLDDYRALVTVAAMSEEWDVVERRAGAMAYLFDDAADEDLFFPLFYRAVALNKLGRDAEANIIYDEIDEKFGRSDQPASQEQVAMALLNKGVTLRSMDRPNDAIAAYDDLLARFGDSDQPAFQEMVATALFNKACIFALRRDSATCIAYLTQWRDRKGKLDCDAIANDSDFDPIRADPDFIAFLRASGCEPTTAPSPAASPVDSKPSSR